MKIFADKNIRQFFAAITIILAFFMLLSQLTVKFLYNKFSPPLFALSLFAAAGVLAACFWYFHRQNTIMAAAVSQINAYLDGNTDARIDCNKEGEMYLLFHAVNTLAAVLNAHASNELKEKDFLKNTISDISHQLKTPLAALNIYNGLLQGEAEELPAIREFVSLSEQELDRMENLVQNLLKITRLDAGTIILEQNMENIADMMKDIELRFSYRANQEQKEIILSGTDDILLFCDRDWLMEALENIVKNALDHTAPGDSVYISWKQLTSMIQIVIKDNGIGIHPEDLHHIFKRFYRSRFSQDIPSQSSSSQDIQGIGLGLPIAKAIIEAHNGSIEADSAPGEGTSFTINFINNPIPTRL